MLLSSSARSATLFTTLAAAAKLLEPVCPATTALSNQCGLRPSYANTRIAPVNAAYSTLSLTKPKRQLHSSTTRLQSSIPARSMASTSTPDPAAKDVLDYWFSLDVKGWFMESSTNDKIITERFGSLVDKARLTDELDSWMDTAAGSLALIILLDQFTRNIFRPGNHPNPGLSWSGDAKALRIAAQAISKGFDREIAEKYASTPMMGFVHRFFVYMPYMHAEDIHCQIASCALFDNLDSEFELRRWKNGRESQELTEDEKTLKSMIDAGTGMAVRHRDCVLQHGRFPKRNEPLGRETTAAEKEFLEKNPGGF